MCSVDRRRLNESDETGLERKYAYPGFAQVVAASDLQGGHFENRTASAPMPTAAATMNEPSPTLS